MPPWSPEPGHAPPRSRAAPEMPGQRSLLERPAPARPAAMLDPETSWDAGRPDTPRKRVHRSRLRADVLHLHQVAGDGLTDDELDQLLPLDDRATIAKRRGDLVSDGHLGNTGRTRLTRRGCTAIVWGLVR